MAMFTLCCALLFFIGVKCPPHFQGHECVLELGCVLICSLLANWYYVDGFFKPMFLSDMNRKCKKNCHYVESLRIIFLVSMVMRIYILLS